MPCDSNKEGLLSQLKELVAQIDDGGCPSSCKEPQPCCAPCAPPFAQVCFTCPPCVPLPTTPCPVKPLQMPCPKTAPTAEEMVAAERAAYNSRYDNFYNSYNIDIQAQRAGGNNCGACKGGKKRACEDYLIQKKNGNGGCCKGCPTGFKPCTMKLQPPPCCNPIGAWCAQVQPCPPKPKPPVTRMESTAATCKRPCCKHWKPKDGPCRYDDPCVAHCYDHPPGIKPSGRFP